MSPRAEQHFQIGKHLLTLEPPDLIRIVFHGAISPEELRRFAEIEQGIAAEVGGLFVLADASDLGEVPRETRKELGVLGHLPLKAVALCGASFQARVVINMTLLTQKVLLPKDALYPVSLCGTQEQGQQFLAEARAALGLPGRDDDSQG